MTSAKNLAIGLTTIATMGMLTVAAAAEPIGPREDFASAEPAEKFEMILDHHDKMEGKHEVRLAELEESNPELAAKMKERHEVMEAGMDELRAAKDAGNEDRIQEILEEMKAEREEHRAERKEHREAVKAAVESGNYEAFVEALGEHVPEDMTEEKFDQIQEVHQLLDDGDKEGAKELAEEYGLKRPFEKRGHGKRHGMRGMRGERPAEAGGELSQ